MRDFFIPFFNFFLNFLLLSDVVIIIFFQACKVMNMHGVQIRGVYQCLYVQYRGRDLVTVARKCQGLELLQWKSIPSMHYAYMSSVYINVY